MGQWMAPSRRQLYSFYWRNQFLSSRRPSSPCRLGRPVGRSVGRSVAAWSRLGPWKLSAKCDQESLFLLQGSCFWIQIGVRVVQQQQQQ